jgi:RHS repeat-associated protein
VHADHLGTPIRVTRPTDNKRRWQWRPDPFGTLPVNGNPEAVGAFVYNLRYPGQLFDGQAGLHQNYFRDYSPAIGRYVESDPIGLMGGLNTYGYVGANPISSVDPYGLDVLMCKQPAFGWMPVNHQWIKTDSREAGMGGTRGNVPGNQSGDWPGDPVKVKDHTGRSKEKSSSCEVVPNVDENRVNKLLELERPLGRWGPTNQCQSFVKEVLKNARYSPGASGSWGGGASGSW